MAGGGVIGIVSGRCVWKTFQNELQNDVLKLQI